MEKKPTIEQIEKLEELYKSLNSLTYHESSVGICVHFIQILKDIDSSSQFYSTLSFDIISFKSTKDDKPKSMLPIMKMAIDYYKSKK